MPYEEDDDIFPFKLVLFMVWFIVRPHNSECTHKYIDNIAHNVV